MNQRALMLYKRVMQFVSVIWAISAIFILILRYTLAFPDASVPSFLKEFLVQNCFYVYDFIGILSITTLSFGLFTLLYWRLRYRHRISKKVKQLLNWDIGMSSFLYIWALPGIIYSVLSVFMMFFYDPFYLKDIYVGGEMLHYKGGTPMIFQHLQWYYSHYVIYLLGFAPIQLLFVYYLNKFSFSKNS